MLISYLDVTKILSVFFLEGLDIGHLNFCRQKMPGFFFYFVSPPEVI